MTENETPFEADLRHLGERLRVGLAKRHPVTGKRLQAVRDIVRQQWEKEQERQAAGGKAKQTQAKQEQKKPGQSAEQAPPTKPAPKSKSPDKDWGHSY